MKKEVKLSELDGFVKEFLNNIEDKNVFGLFGNLGAGKTTFTKEVAKQLGIEQEITSPTFTIMQSYEVGIDTSDSGLQLKNLIHIDLYRIENEKELEVLKLEEVFKNKDNLVLVEWADKLGQKAHDSSVMSKIIFDYKDEGSRLIEIVNG